VRNPQLSYYSGPVYQDSPTYMGPASQRGRVFLVAVHGEQLQTSGRGSFDRVHVMVVDPNQMADLSHPLSVLCALPDVNSSIPATVPGRGLLAVQSRPVRGEILRNQQGQLYEKRGRQLVPLASLVSGPRGEVIEFLPPVQHTENTAPKEAEGFEVDEFAEDDVTEEKSRYDEKSKTVQGQLGIRKLFPDPGQLRLLNYGDFSPLLASQLKHPERLREAHQLPCYVQVIEVRRPTSIPQLAKYLGEDAGQLHVLNPWMAQKLGLASLLPKLRRSSPSSRPLPVPGEFVCRLQIVRDPTADLDNSLPTSHSAHQAASAEPSITSRRTTIPECYLKPWELKLSREEALYEMNSARVPKGFFKRLISLFRERVPRSDFERWTALLSNKNAEEQLWAVRPPRHGLNKAQIRAWACNALTAAGYDAQQMVAEWEIYWRRKGLC
jgi:hypothetical protein